MRNSLFLLVLASLSGTTYSQPFKHELSQAINSRLPSTVTIVVIDQSGAPLSHGSGFFLTPDGEVVTNAHVIGSNSARHLRIRNFNGGEHRVQRIVAISKDHDIAILKAIAKNVASAPLANSDSLVIGQGIFVVGTPAMLEFDNTVSSGIVSQLREINGIRQIQFDASVSPGSSGGPIFDNSGSVVGIVRAYSPVTPDNRPTQNLNLGIPSNYIAALRQSAISIPTAPDTSTRAAAAWKAINVVFDSAFTFALTSPPNPIPQIFYPFQQRVGTMLRHVSTLVFTRYGRTTQAQLYNDAIASAVVKEKDPTKFLTALSVLGNAIESDTAKFILAHLLLSQGDTMKARDEFTSIRSLSSLLSPPTLGDFIGMWLLGLRREALGIVDSFNTGQRVQAILFASQHSLDSLESSHALRVLSSSEEISVVLELKAMLHFQRGEYLHAAEQYRKLILINPLESLHHRNLATANYHIGNLQVARDELAVAWQLARSSELEFLFAVLALKSLRPDLALDIVGTTFHQTEHKKALLIGTANALLGNRTHVLRVYESLRHQRDDYAQLLGSMIY